MAEKPKGDFIMSKNNTKATNNNRVEFINVPIAVTVGEDRNGCAKPVINIRTGVIYNSATDAAVAEGITQSAMSQKCHRESNKEWCYLSDLGKNFEVMLGFLSDASKVNETREQMYQAQIEAEKRRKAEDRAARAEAKRLAEERRKAEVEARKEARAKARREKQIAELEAQRDKLLQKQDEVATNLDTVMRKLNAMTVESGDLQVVVA